MTSSNTQYAELAERMDDFNERFEKIVGGLPVGSASSAIALLTSLNAGLFLECAAALRARSHLTGEE